MDHDEIRESAQDYISRESDPDFRSEVEALLQGRGLERARGPLLSRPGVRHRGTARRDRRRLQPDEHASWSPGPPRALRLPSGRPSRQEPVRLHRLRFAALFRRLRRALGPRLRRQRDQGLSFHLAQAHARAVLRDTHARRRHGHRRYGEPQSAQVQRLQGLLERRRPGHSPARRGNHRAESRPFARSGRWARKRPWPRGLSR